MYDMQIHIKGFPFLESSLHTLGMLNYQPISQIMSRPVITLNEIDKVSRIMDVLTNTTHNGFPVVGKDGKLRGLILRKTLLGLLKMKVFSVPKAEGSKMADGGILLEQTSTVTYDQLERNYPVYPTLKDIKLKPEDYEAYIDTRVNYDPAPSVLNLNTSIRKCYNLFRTMGYRHTVVIDAEMRVVGIITRYDMNEHRLHHLWEHQGNRMQKDLSVDILPPAIVYEVKTDSIGRGRSGSVMASQPELVDDETDPEIIQMDGVVSDSPTVSLRKGFKPK
jgi:chloride channel 7